MESLDSHSINTGLHTKVMKQILLLLSKPTINHQVAPACCKHSCKVRNKGALLVLVWNFLVMNLFHYIAVQTPFQSFHTVTLIFTFPIAGWLADVYFGKYKMVYWSMWIIWLATMVATVNSVVAQLVRSYTSINTVVALVLLHIQAIGLGGFLANILNLGIDQLQDASANEIISFIRWCVWTIFSGGIVIQNVYGSTPEDYRILLQCITCVCVTISLSLSFLISSLLTKEPVTQNPYKLIYQVIKHYLKNNRPKHRSAFTYCEDDLPSRIDFGKSKYGGPFTTEQVEDVKTFLRLVSAIIVGSILVIETFNAGRLYYSLVDQIGNNSHIPHWQVYLLGKVYGFGFICIFGTVIIPFHEFVFYPLFCKHLPWGTSKSKIFLGALLQLARVTALMIIELNARHAYLNHYGHNATLQCIFLEKHGILSSTFDARWIVFPTLLNSTSYVLIGIGILEFICSQSPNLMRGLLLGIGLGSISVFCIVGYGIQEPFTRNLHIWGTGTISCGFWNLLLMLLFTATYCVMLLLMLKCYKGRKREDVLPNEHIFAERYYDND